MKKTRAGSKGEETKLKVLNAAVKALGRFGERETSFQKIADICGVSQPLVVHYFQKRENIFNEVIQYLLARALVETQAALADVKDPRAKLRAYLEVSLKFIRQEPELGRVYMLFYYRSAYEDSVFRMNIKLKQEATARIATIIDEGIQKKIFEVSDVQLTAKTIHNSLTGLILNALTDTSEFKDHELLRELERGCLSLLGLPS